MSWVDEALPLPSARPVEADEALEAAIHAFAALAAGIAAIQLMSSVVFRDLVPAAVFAALLAATGACAFVGDASSSRRAAFATGGSATVIVWLTVLPQAHGQTALVVLAMAAVSAVLTRQWLSRGAPIPSAELAAAASEPLLGWIEDDADDGVAGLPAGPM